MKKFNGKAAALLCGGLAAVLGIAGCGETETVYRTEIVPDPEPYTFVNPGHPVAETDADMTIDGKLDEGRWEEANWLVAVDRINARQYADISFTASYGEKGIYFGMRVEEHGTTIFVNPDRSFVNSCIEMYMGPVGVPDNTLQTLEFDFLPDGTYANRVNSNGLVGAMTTWDKTPVLAVELIGGELNTPECTGYVIEAFIPFPFLEFCGWDVSDPENMIVGINPAHIFSFNYEGTDLNADRLWSNWAEDYIPVQWLQPDSYFWFGKDGLLSYDIILTSGGSGSGSVETQSGLPLLAGKANTIVVKPRNGASVTKFIVDGEDCLSQLRYSGGSYLFDLPTVNADVNIEADFN